MPLKNYIIVLFFLLVSKPLLAQEQWSLEECISFAIAHNLQLKDLTYTAASGKETYKQSVRDVLPRVNGFSNYNIRFGRSVDPNDNSIINTDFFSNDYSLQSSLDLFQGFQKINGIKASKFLYKATKEEALQEKYLLAFRVMQAFYDIQFAEGLLAISNEQQEVSQANFDFVKKQIELGVKAGADLYEAESLLLNDKLKVTQSKNQLVAAKLNLIQEMNLENATDITIITALPEETTDNENVESEAVFSKAQEFLPILKARNFQVKAAKKQVAVARGALYPSLSIVGAIGTGFFETTTDANDETIPFRDQFRDNTFRFVGLSLSVPISNAWSGRSNVKQQKIAHLRAKNNLEQQQQELFQTIQQLVQEYNALQIEYEQSLQKVEAQQLSFTIAQKRYEKGLINALDLFTAKNLFANAQNENLLVRLRSEVNKSTLDFYNGLPIFNINAN